MKPSLGMTAKVGLLVAGLVSLPSIANAATAMLATNDYVGISFWTISMAMVAASIETFCLLLTIHPSKGSEKEP